MVVQMGHPCLPWVEHRNMLCTSPGWMPRLHYVASNCPSKQKIFCRHTVHMCSTHLSPLSKSSSLLLIWHLNTSSNLVGYGSVFITVQGSTLCPVHSQMWPTSLVHLWLKHPQIRHASGFFSNFEPCCFNTVDPTLLSTWYCAVQ